MPFVVIALFAAGVGLTFRLWRRAQENLAALADRLGFQIVRQPGVLGLSTNLPRVEGQHRRRDVSFFTYTEPSPYNSQIYSVIAAKYVGGLGFVLRRSLSFLPSFAGGRLQPVLTEDTDFDQVFSFKTNDPVTARTLLTPEIRRELLDIRQQPGGLSGRLAIEKGEVRYTLQGSFSNQRLVEILVARLDLVCSLAEQVEKCREPSRARSPLSARNPKQI